MAFPAIKLHHLYSVDFYPQMSILFENLDMIDIPSVTNAIKTKSGIIIVPGIFQIDLDIKRIILTGYNINDTTYMVNRAGKGDTIFLSYTCSDEIIWQGVEYLYHMYQNLVKRV
jgi:hypothetical protein